MASSRVGPAQLSPRASLKGPDKALQVLELPAALQEAPEGEARVSVRAGDLRVGLGAEVGIPEPLDDPAVRGLS